MCVIRSRGTCRQLFVPWLGIFLCPGREKAEKPGIVIPGEEVPFMVEFENEAFLEQLEQLVEQKRWPQLRDMLVPLEPADIAEILDELPEDRLPLLYRLLPKELAAEVFVEMEPDLQELLIKTFSDTSCRNKKA